MFGRIVSILFKILVAFGTLRVHEIVISTEGRDHVGMTHSSGFGTLPRGAEPARVFGHSGLRKNALKK